MQVKKLQHYIQQYKTFLRKDRDSRRLFPWESLRHFQEHWDIAAADPAAMYDRCLQNSQSQRLWKREAWFPKEMMLELIAMDPEFVGGMFIDLFDEDLEAAGRITRFKDSCDELMQPYLKKTPRPKSTDHFHGDNEMVFMYLAFRFPEKYTLYDYPAFRKMMQLLETPNIPSPYELDRFIKLTSAMGKFLSRDEELVGLHLKRLVPGQHYAENNLLWVYEFYVQQVGS